MPAGCQGRVGNVPRVRWMRSDRAPPHNKMSALCWLSPSLKRSGQKQVVEGVIGGISLVDNKGLMCLTLTCRKCVCFLIIIHCLHIPIHNLGLNNKAHVSRCIYSAGQIFEGASACFQKTKFVLTLHSSTSVSLTFEFLKLIDFYSNLNYNPYLKGFQNTTYVRLSYLEEIIHQICDVI